MKNYLVTGWEPTEYRLYHLKENAIKDFEEMLSDEGLGLDEANPLAVEEVIKEEDDEYGLFYIAYAIDKFENSYYAIIESITFEDEE